MILFALDSFTSKNSALYSFLLGPGFRPCKLGGPIADGAQLAAVVKSAGDYLVHQIATRPVTDPLVKSGTYGNNDPFTLTWLVELTYRLLQPGGAPALVLERIVQAADAALQRSTILETSIATVSLVRSLARF
jgi:hypothetical protein